MLTLLLDLHAPWSGSAGDLLSSLSAFLTWITAFEYGLLSTALLFLILLWLFISEHMKVDSVLTMGTFHDICSIWLSALSALEELRIETVKSLAPFLNMDCCFA